MKKILPLLLLASVSLFKSNPIHAQCTTGYTTCGINWDYLDYFPSAGISTYTDLARSQTQYFAFGTQRMTITHNFTGSNAVGEDAENTGEAGSMGTGQDVHFIGDGAVNISLQKSTDNFKFSIYDIDYNQRITITANSGTVVTVTRLSGTNLTVSSPGTTTASATAGATNAIATNNTDGTINVSISGPVTNVSIVATQTSTKTNGQAADREDGSFWLSDISACSEGTFSTNFFQAAKPYTNQPGYVLAVRNNSVYYVDPSTGSSKALFTDPGHTNINSMAYDPVNKYLYYVFSLTASDGTTEPSNRTLRRYNYNTDTFGIVMADVRTLIPTFDVGVESGAAAFYDGSLYLGIESSSGSANESIVWKVDFDLAQNPVAASQVYAIPGANHDWADISVVNGMLYDFDGSATAPDFYHLNLYTHEVANLAPASGLVPRQSSVDWNNNVFHIGQPGSGSNSEIAPYLYNGSLNDAAKHTITLNNIAVTGSWGDAAEAFRPRVDFGDAPATYDPLSGDPAVHETSASIFLGTNSNNEWTSRGQTVLANSDNFDDGIIMGSLLNPSAGTYFAEVRYLNNTGSTATIVAWIDFNNNGLFDAGEGQVQTNLPSNASTQSAFFQWNGITTSLVDGSYTYLRLRIANASSNMTTANATGYFGAGEVEDHRVVVSISPLTTRLENFTVNKNDAGEVNVYWKVRDEQAGTVYTLQRSTDMQTWNDVISRAASTDRVAGEYFYRDAPIQSGTCYYRLMLAKTTSIYSAIRKVEYAFDRSLTVSPNPASSKAHVFIQTAENEAITIRVFDAGGRVVSGRSMTINKGNNKIDLPADKLPDGMYWVQLNTADRSYIEQLVIKK